MLEGMELVGIGSGLFVYLQIGIWSAGASELQDEYAWGFGDAVAGGGYTCAAVSRSSARWWFFLSGPGHSWGKTRGSARDFDGSRTVKGRTPVQPLTLALTHRNGPLFESWNENPPSIDQTAIRILW